MKAPRFRIAWIMVAVAIAALEFWAIRVLMEFDPSGSLVAGALPVANILVIGLLIGQRHPGSRPFLAGFEMFGATALAIYVASAIVGHRGELQIAYLRPFIDEMEKNIGRDRPFVFFPTLCIGSVVMLGLPQLAFALIGGFHSRSYFRVTITRR